MKERMKNNIYGYEPEDNLASQIRDAQQLKPDAKSEDDDAFKSRSSTQPHKKKKADPLDKEFKIRVSASEHNQIKKIAEADSRSLSNFIRNAINRDIGKRGRHILAGRDLKDSLQIEMAAINMRLLQLQNELSNLPTEKMMKNILRKLLAQNIKMNCQPDDIRELSAELAKQFYQQFEQELVEQIAYDSRKTVQEMEKISKEIAEIKKAVEKMNGFMDGKEPFPDLNGGN